MRSRPPLRFHAKALRQIQRVVVSIPGEDAALAKERGNLRRIVIAETQRKRRAALRKTFRIGDPENAQARESTAAHRSAAPASAHSYGDGRAIRRQPALRAASSPLRRNAGPVPRGNPPPRRSPRSVPAPAFPFPSAPASDSSRAALCRDESAPDVALSVKRAHVRAEKLVRRADQEIAIERLHIDQSVRRVMHRVDEHQRARRRAPAW